MVMKNRHPDLRAVTTTGMSKPPDEKEEIPCDGCVSNDHCRKHRLACKSFLIFVNERLSLTPEDPEPTWAMYDAIYEELSETIDRGNRHPSGWVGLGQRDR